MSKIDFNTEDFDKLKISELKRIADYWQRQWLLKNRCERDGRKRIFCPLTKKWNIESKMQCSHFIDRAIMNTRYDEDNVHLISSNSNMWDSKVMVDGYKSKHHKEYEEYLKEKIGEKKFKKLLEKSKEIRIFARQDYVDVIKKYRD